MAGIIFSKGSGLNDSIYGKSQEPIRAVIEKNVEAFEQQSQIKNVFFMDSTRNYCLLYTSVSYFPQVATGARNRPSSNTCTSKCRYVTHRRQETSKKFGGWPGTKPRAALCASLWARKRA